MTIYIDKTQLPLSTYPGLNLGRPKPGRVQMTAPFTASVGGEDLKPYTVFEVHANACENLQRAGYMLVMISPEASKATEDKFEQVMASKKARKK